MEITLESFQDRFIKSFSDYKLTLDQLDVVWTMMAHGMRDLKTKEDYYEYSVITMLIPFFHFFDQSGFSPEQYGYVIGLLRYDFWEGEFKFPFGKLVTKEGLVTAIDLY